MRPLQTPSGVSWFVSRTGYGIVGRPGAGKSTARRILGEQLNAIQIETGDIVRELACDHFGVESADELTSTQLGKFSTMKRKTDGGDYVIQEVFDRLRDRQDFPERPVVVAGIRDTETPELLYDFFDEFELVWIQAPFHVRHERLTNRDRQDEGSMTFADLVERDRREEQWGTGDLTEEADRVVVSRGPIDDLREKLNKI